MVHVFRDCGGEKQCAGGTFAESGSEERGAAHLLGDQIFDVLDVEGEQFGAGRFVLGVGESDDDTVVGGRRAGIDAVSFLQARPDGEGPRCVNPLAVRGMQHQTPVTEFVAEAFDHQVRSDGTCPVAFFCSPTSWIRLVVAL